MTVSADGTMWLYCPRPTCAFRVRGAANPTCNDCGASMRIWKDPDDKPPPKDVSTIKKRGTGMSEVIQ